MVLQLIDSVGIASIHFLPNGAFADGDFILAALTAVHLYHVDNPAGLHGLVLLECRVVAWNWLVGGRLQVAVLRST